MDSARPARSVFTVEEINAFVQTIRKAFQAAAPNEWLVFALIQSRGDECAVTSGAMFIESARLHVVVANHRTILALNSEELARVKANPLYSVTGSGGALAFDSPRFVMGRKANWSGGHRASASELILDHAAFLSYLKPAGGSSTLFRPAATSDPDLAMGLGTSQGQPSDGRDIDSEAVIAQLREEIVRLKKLMADKDAEIDRLKHQAAPSTSSSP